MKQIIHMYAIVLCLLIQFVWAETTIDPFNKYAYGANIGWINAGADETNGMVVGQAFCSGYLYSASCGWIHLGGGTPVSGLAYANDSTTDFGVNHDGLGNLTGYAYGANIGWINFEQTYGKPKVDLSTGMLSGYAWGANVGWISLNTTQGYVRTLTLDSGPDVDEDGIPDAWEYGHTNSLASFSNDGADFDDDGVSDVDEYLADTDPSDPLDRLIISDFQVAGTTNWVTWTVKPTRQYALQRTAKLGNGMSWEEGVPSFSSTGLEVTEEVSGVTNSATFYRIKASLPLSL